MNVKFSLLSEAKSPQQQITARGHGLRLGFAVRLLLSGVLTFSSTLYLPGESAAQQASPNKQPEQIDPWKPLRLFIGSWEGDSQGQPGNGKTDRQYAFVLRNRFVQASNKAVYPPQDKNPRGEIHEDLGLFSYDRASKKLVFRQFHVEGFVIHYTLQSVSEDGRTIVFTSTGIENIAPGWVARETYRFVSDDEFIETFSLAGPGKEFETYSETRLRRKL